jgi:hypothetical protein
MIYHQAEIDGAVPLNRPVAFITVPIERRIICLPSCGYKIYGVHASIQPQLTEQMKSSRATRRLTISLFD